MFKNHKLVSSQLTGAATTTNLKLQSLDSVYTRLLNKNIDLTLIKKEKVREKKIIKKEWSPTKNPVQFNSIKIAPQ